MTLRGRVKNGVVVLHNGAALPLMPPRHGLNISRPLNEQHQAVHSGISASCPGSRAGSTVSSSPG
jgi:hypothetical protein